MTFAEFAACLRGFSRANGAQSDAPKDADYDVALAAIALFESDSSTVH